MLYDMSKIRYARPKVPEDELWLLDCNHQEVSHIHHMRYDMVSDRWIELNPTGYIYGGGDIHGHDGSNTAST